MRGFGPAPRVSAWPRSGGYRPRSTAHDRGHEAGSARRRRPLPHCRAAVDACGRTPRTAWPRGPAPHDRPAPDPFDEEYDPRAGRDWRLVEEDAPGVSHHEPLGLRERLSLNRMGTFDWDLDRGSMDLDPGAMDVFDLRPDEYDGAPASLVTRVPPEEGRRLDEALSQALLDGHSSYGPTSGSSAATGPSAGPTPRGGSCTPRTGSPTGSSASSGRRPASWRTPRCCARSSRSGSGRP